MMTLARMATLHLLKTNYFSPVKKHHLPADWVKTQYLLVYFWFVQVFQGSLKRALPTAVEARAQFLTLQ